MVYDQSSSDTTHDGLQLLFDQLQLMFFNWTFEECINILDSYHRYKDDDDDEHIDYDYGDENYPIDGW